MRTPQCYIIRGRLLGKVDAIGIHSNDNQGRWPDDPYFGPMWRELNRLELPKPFEQMVLRGHAERLFPRFKV